MKNRGYLQGTVVKTFGRLYNEFLPTKICIVQENGVRRAHEVPTRQGAGPVGVGAPSTLVEASCPYRTTSFFLKFLNIPKLIKNCHWSCFRVGLLTVPHTYSFSESETFRKVSLMYSSGVTVSIILVSTFIGLPEI